MKNKAKIVNKLKFIINNNCQTGFSIMYSHQIYDETFFYRIWFHQLSMLKNVGSFNHLTVQFNSH